MRTLPLLATIALTLMTACGGSSPKPPDDHADNECLDVAGGPTPVTLTAQGDWEAAGDLSVQRGKVYWRTADNGFFDGGVFSMPVGGGSVTRIASGNVDHLVVTEREVYWFDHFVGLFASPGHPSGWDVYSDYLMGLAVDPIDDGFFVEFRNTLSHYDASGRPIEGYTGDFNGPIAATANGLYAITIDFSTSGPHGNSGQMLYLPRRSSTWTAFGTYDDQRALDLKADDRGAVWLFEDEVGSIGADGTSFRILHTSPSAPLEQVAIDDVYAYWTEKTSFGRSIRRIARDGSTEPETLFESRCKPSGLAVDGGHIYWVTYLYRGFEESSPGAVWSIPK